MKRSPIRPGAPLKRTPMRRGPSKRQAAKNRKRAPVMRTYLEAHPRCELRGYLDGQCTQWATEVHEPWTRRRGGPTDDPANMVALCHNCHRSIHLNPRMAQPMGLLVHAEAGPAWLAARKAQTA